MSLVSERPRSGPPHYNGGQYKHTKHFPKIRLDSAMRDFQAMFPGLTPMVIEAVLRANGGAVDPTVEKLISMCCEQQQQQKKEKELLDDSDLLPGYYEACCKEQPPPSYHATQSYQDASTQTEGHSESSVRTCRDEPMLESDIRLSDNVGHLCVATHSSSSSSSISLSSSLSSDNSTSSVKEDDEKVALYLQNKELLQQLRQKERIIEYLERNSCREQNNGIKPNRYSDPVMSLVPHMEGNTGTVHHPITRSTRSRRAQTLSIQRQQNSSPPPNATVDTKETLDIPDHSMLPGLSRNQPCRKSAKKRLQNWSKKLLRRNVGSDTEQVSPASSQAQLLQQDGDSSIDSSSASHC